MSTYYRIELPEHAEVGVLYHDLLDPAVLQFEVPPTPPPPPATGYVTQYEVRLPRESEARIVPTTGSFAVTLVTEGEEPLLTDPVSSIHSPIRTFQ